jgi:predicted NUDIX family NTP pyrophosphohydrolase
MPKTSAGLLMYRLRNGELEFLLVHPGGPFFRNKDAGAWSIPKGEIEAGEELLGAAQREFAEETGFPPMPPFLELSPVTQKGGKIVHAWAFAGDCDPSQLRSNTFKMEWPPRSGQMREFPEMDRAGWFALAGAKLKIKAAQIPLLEEFSQKIA